MYKVMKTFICRGCVIPVTGSGCTSIDIGVNANLELVDKFCYLGYMLSVDGDADEAVENEVAPQRAEIRTVRWMCGMKLQDRIPSKGL